MNVIFFDYNFGTSTYGMQESSISAKKSKCNDNINNHPPEEGKHFTFPLDFLLELLYSPLRAGFFFIPGLL